MIQRTELTAKLTELLENSTGRQFGRSQSPPNNPFPYGVVYTVPGGSFSGPVLSTPEADAACVYQINTVALSDLESSMLMDTVRATLLERSPKGRFAVPFPTLSTGYTVIDRRPDGGPGDMTYQGAPPKRVFTSTERFVLHVTPTNGG